MFRGFRSLTWALLVTATGQLVAICQEREAPLPRRGTVKVAAIQCSSDMGEVLANRTKLTDLVRQAAGAGAKFMVLPETAITGYLSQDLKENWHVAERPLERGFTGRSPTAFAEAVPGPSTDHFCQLAKELGIYLTIPLLERSDATDSSAKG